MSRFAQPPHKGSRMPEMTIICRRRVSYLVLWIVIATAVNTPLRAQSDPAEPVAHPSIRVGGFADVELHTSSDNVREGLDLAELDLYSSASLSQRWSALAEVVAQRTIHRRETDGEAVFELDLERLYVSYSPSDAFTLEL